MKAVAQELKALADANQLRDTFTMPGKFKCRFAYNNRSQWCEASRQKEHSVAFAQFALRISVLMKFGIGVDDDPF